MSKLRHSPRMVRQSSCAVTGLGSAHAGTRDGAPRTIHPLVVRCWLARPRARFGHQVVRAQDTYAVERRQRGRDLLMSWKNAWTCGLIAVGACTGTVDEQDETTSRRSYLAALMEDGPLPATMKGSEDVQKRRPRFWLGGRGGFPFPTGDGDGDLVSPPIFLPGSPIFGGGSAPRPISRPTVAPATFGVGLARAGMAMPMAVESPTRAPARAMLAAETVTATAETARARASRSASGASMTATPSAPSCSDSSHQGHTAFRNVALSCVPGQEGQAVSFAATGTWSMRPTSPTSRSTKA